MLEFNKSYSDSKKILDELLVGNGVVVFRDVYPIDQINKAREIVNALKLHFNVLFSSFFFTPTV